VDLESGRYSENDAERLMREAHSLKGASRSVGRTDIERICQNMEDIFSLWGKTPAKMSPGLFDTLHEILKTMTDGLDDRLGQDTVERFCVELQSAARGRALPSAEKQTVEKAANTTPGAADDVDHGNRETEKTEPGKQNRDQPVAKSARVPVQVVDTILSQAEELFTFRNRFRRFLENVRRMERETSGFLAGISTGEVMSPERLRYELMDLAREMSDECAGFDRVVENHLMLTRDIMLQPFGTMMEQMRPMVRDMARSGGLKVEFSISGDEIEMDRRVLESLWDPVVHLIRNSLDHGIEPSGEREKAGKPPEATLSASAVRIDAETIEIRIEDDGRGVDIEQVRRAAIKRWGVNAVPSGDDFDTVHAARFLFRSGFTTSGEVTEISGRGLGLAIARDAVEGLGGSMSLNFNPGKGVCFVIRVPVRRSTLSGLVIGESGALFVIPVVHVLRVLSRNECGFQRVGGEQTVVFENRRVPLRDLGSILGFETEAERDRNLVIVLGTGAEQAAVAVEEVIGEETCVLKSLGGLLSETPFVFGATVREDGKTVPVLSTPDIVRAAPDSGVRAARRKTPVARGPEKFRVLVVEDSITARMVLKNILEASGYDVETAVDGLDAFARLRESRYDLLVSDVDMPRLNGFGLVRKIRADKRMPDIPVILVTALETAEDRERGLDAGADAYIVKSGFEQTGLLETVSRLLRSGEEVED